MKASEAYNFRHKIELAASKLDDTDALEMVELFPQWKEEDFQLYAFTSAGFSSTTISALMEKEKSVIYNRVWRLKGRISNSDSSLKEFFLRCLGN